MAEPVTHPVQAINRYQAHELHQLPDWILVWVRDFSIEHERSYRDPPTPQQIRAHLEQAR